MGTWRLDRNQSVLVVVDVQEKLVPVIHDHPRLLRNLEILIRGCHLLGVPILVTEQYSKGLGPTVDSIRAALDECDSYRPIEKMTFSAGGSEEFQRALTDLGRGQVLVAGIETHVCVYQTIMDLIEFGFEATIVADAVSSRTAENRDIALRRLASSGALTASVELSLFELCRVSGTDEFRAISRLVR